MTIWRPAAKTWHKNLVIYLYILIIILSSLTFYTILHIESEKQVNLKHKISNNRNNSPRQRVYEKLLFPDLPPGKDIVINGIIDYIRSFIFY